MIWMANPNPITIRIPKDKNFFLPIMYLKVSHKNADFFRSFLELKKMEIHSYIRVNQKLIVLLALTSFFKINFQSSLKLHFLT